MMLNSSAGDCGTRRTIIFRPSVDPIPIDANDRIDVAFENILPDPLQSPNTNELVRGNDSRVCNGCGDVCDVVNVGSTTSNWLPAQEMIREYMSDECHYNYPKSRLGQ